MSERECCANCRFLHVIHTEYEEPDEYTKGSTDTVPGRYECREASPQLGIQRDFGRLEGFVGWPSTWHGYWCGRFQKAPEA
jgi:hypothetical protein